MGNVVAARLSPLCSAAASEQPFETDKIRGEMVDSTVKKAFDRN